MNTYALKPASGTRFARRLAGLVPLSLSLMATICVVASTHSADSEADAVNDSTLIEPAPGSYRLLTDGEAVSFSFDVFRGDIRFRGEINGHEVHMLLDDGFMWNPLLFWGSPRVDSLGFEYDGETSIGGPDGETEIASRTASNITISFPGVEFTDQTAVITPFSSGHSNMWWGSVGQVSGTFLKHFVVDINFDSMTITLIEPDEFEYNGDGVEIPWRPMGFGPWAIPGTLELTNGREVSLSLMMDLGYNNQLEIATKGEHNIPVPEQAMPASLGFNIQGTETLGHIGRMLRVEIGGYEIRDVIVSYVSEEHSDNTFHEVMIGLGLLSRFNLVFDYSRQRMFIEPNHTFADPFDYNMTGIWMRRGKGPYFEIAHVQPGSPADEADLRIGDRILRINSKDVMEYSIWDLRPILQQEGSTVTLIVQRGGKESEIDLKLQRVI